MNEIKIENNEYWNSVNNSTVRLVELYNPRKLDIMLNNWSHPILQKALLKSSTEEGTDSEDDMTAVNTLFSHLKSYRKKSKCRVGATEVSEFETTYNQTGKTKIKSGRYFAKGSLSLQSFKKVQERPPKKCC